LLKDGDWIGYGKLNDFVNDDLQTDEDISVKYLLFSSV